MLQALKKCKYNKADKKFDYLSNFTKFTSAKMAGVIDTGFESMVEFLKYELDHAARPIVIQRLVSQCLTEYKKKIMEEVCSSQKLKNTSLKG